MAEDNTQKMPDARSFEERVFARFDAVDATLNTLAERQTGLEEKVDARLRDTRPIWESVQVELSRINSKLDLALKDLFETRAELATLNKRVTQLEGERQI